MITIRHIRKRIADSGLELAEYRYNTHYRCIVRHPETGREATVTLASSPSDVRTSRNERALLRRTERQLSRTK